MRAQLIDLFTKIFSIFNLLLIFISLILNSLLLLICIRSKKLRSTSTFKLIAFNSINDIIVCITWNLSDFLSSFFYFKPYNHSLFYCRFLNIFLQYSATSFMSWHLVSVSLDRLLSMMIRGWYNVYFTGIRPIIFSTVLAIVILAVYFNQNFLIGGIFNINGTEQVICYISATSDIDWYFINSQVKNFKFIDYI